MDIEKMSSDEFKAFCRSGNKNYFTRIRKMPLQDLLFTMINRKGLTLALELRNYMKLAHPGVSISKPGYLKQRMKLNPDAFLELYKYHNRNFYADSTFSTYKDHLILAADGSDINIPIQITIYIENFICSHHISPLSIISALRSSRPQIRP
jgi:hypothetical protein